MTLRARGLALGLGVSLAGSPWPAVAAAGAPSQVLVDADEVGTMPARMVADVTTNVTRALDDAGLGEASVRVTFVEIDPMTVQRGVRVWLVHGDVTVADPGADPRGRLLASCSACSDVELAGLAIEAVLEAIELHAEAVEAGRLAEAAPAPTVSAPSPEPVVEPDQPSSPPGPRLGPPGWAGVAALGLGVGAVIPGAVLASRRPRPFPGEPRMDVLRDLRPAGYAMLGVAGAFLVTGAVLLIVERRRAARHRSLGRSWPPHATSSIAMPPRG